MTDPICPECVAGKCVNCPGWALDYDDREVPCECELRGHRP